jgi:hypothetical protein
MGKGSFLLKASLWSPGSRQRSVAVSECRGEKYAGCRHPAASRQGTDGADQQAYVFIVCPTIGQSPHSACWRPSPVDGRQRGVA